MTLAEYNAALDRLREIEAAEREAARWQALVPGADSPLLRDVAAADYAVRRSRGELFPLLQVERFFRSPQELARAFASMLDGRS